MAKLETDERHDDAHHPEADRGKPDVDRIDGEGEAHGQVVDAQGEGRDKEAFSAQAARHPRFLLDVDEAGLHDRVGPGQDQDRPADVLAVPAEKSGHLVADHEPEHGHEHLEATERDAHPRPRPDLDTSQTEAKPPAHYTYPAPQRQDGARTRSSRGRGLSHPTLLARPRQADFHAQRGLRDPRGASPHSDYVRALEHDSAQAHRYESKALLAPRRDEAPGDPDLDPRASRQPRWRSLHPRSAQTSAERWSRTPGRPEEPGRDAARRLTTNLV